MARAGSGSSSSGWRGSPGGILPGGFDLLFLVAAAWERAEKSGRDVGGGAHRAWSGGTAPFVQISRISFSYSVILPSRAFSTV